MGEKYKWIDGGITAPQGYKAFGLAAGLKEKSQLDTALIVSEKPAIPAIVTTKNAVKAAPVLWDNRIVSEGNAIKAVIVNSGNANACTGVKGLQDVRDEARAVAMALNCEMDQVFVSSTGVIGVPLSVDKITDAIPALVDGLSVEGADAASRAILTTDMVPKTAAVELKIEGRTIKIGAMAKGSGMICPNMATMLSFVTTDANIDRQCLQQMLSIITEDTYNMMSVDGDMSTNDTVLVMANGMADTPRIDDAESAAYGLFFNALYTVNERIAKSIVRDGEGATKFIEVSVINAESVFEAKLLAKAVIKSNLVKTAFYGEDANWGRVLSSIGASGVQFDPNTVDLIFSSARGSLKLLEKGIPVAFDETAATEILSEKDIDVLIDMGMGIYRAKAWGCDLSHEYVHINSDYRS